MALSYTVFDYSNHTAKILLDINAVQYRPHDPFVFASGRLSPVYCDLRLLMSYPMFRNQVVNSAISTLCRDPGVERMDVIAGGESGGIALAALIANRLDKPMIYVRKEAKVYGRSSQVEGGISPGKRALLVDDVMTEGRTKLAFSNALEKVDYAVNDVFVVFNYGCFEASDFFQCENLSLHWLTDLSTVLDVAVDQPCYLTPYVPALREYADAPDQWQKLEK